MMDVHGGMEEYSFSDYPNLDAAPVDVEATLNSLLASTPTESYDNEFSFSAPLISSSSSLRTAGSHQLNVPPRLYPVNTNNSANVPDLNNADVNVNVNNSLYPILPPPSQPPTPVTVTPNTPNLMASQLDSKKKRRRTDALSDEVCKGFDWSFYQSPQMNYVVYDAVSMQPLNEYLDVYAYKSGTNTHFSNTEKAWISYRQNQFKIYCLLKAPQLSGPMFVRDGATEVPVRDPCVKLYAVKSNALGLPQEEALVGLYHAGKSRVKKEKTEIVAIPFVDGKAEFSNLQFERSNAAKGQQEYFHLVVTIYVAGPIGYYPVVSKISPRIIVRSQHPGFYGPPSPEQSQDQVHSISSTSSEESTSPKPFENDPSWHQSGESVFRMGKVGINTSDPTESLTVHGNALVTGNLYKPSDRRIKSEIVPVDSTEQLDTIRSLKIYDYKIQDREERGVIAQELQTVMPPAVHEAGDVVIGGRSVPNLLVVNERSLLYENIGATQELDKHLQIEKLNIIQVDSRVDDLQKTVEQDKAQLQDQIESVSALFFAAEKSKDALGEVWKEEQVVFGLNLFKMGPARSFMVLGYFFSYLWLVGALYCFSSIHSRKILGKACIIKFLIWWCLFFLILGDFTATVATCVYWAIGATLLLGNWKRNKSRIEGKEVQEGRRWRCWERTFLRRASVTEEKGFLESYEESR